MTAAGEAPAARDAAAAPLRWLEARPWLWLTLPAVGWILMVAWAEMAPPEQLPRVSFPLADKGEHACAYLGLSLLLLRDWLRGAPARWRPALTVTLACAVYGFYLECLQGLSGYRDFELMDALANSVGAAAGVALWSAWSRWLRLRVLPTHVDHRFHAGR